MAVFTAEHQKDYVEKIVFSLDVLFYADQEWDSSTTLPLVAYRNMLCMYVILKQVIAFWAHFTMHMMPTSVLLGNIFYSNTALVQQFGTLRWARSSSKSRALILPLLVMVEELPQ